MSILTKKPFRPMLAAKCDSIADLRRLPYPVFGTPKIDGFRCTILDGEPQTRTGKPIPNVAVADWLRHHFAGCTAIDGELLLVDVQTGQPLPFTKTSSVLRAFGAPSIGAYQKPDGTAGEYRTAFIAFDYEFLGSFEGWYSRMQALHTSCWSAHAITMELIEDEAAAISYNERCLAAGYEGVVFRTGHGLYKQGRSTWTDAAMVKVKPWADDEAVVVGVIEAMTNVGERKFDELGYSRTSHRQEDRVPAGMLGALRVRSPKWPIDFEVSARMMPHWRMRELWEQRDELLGSLITFKYLDYGGKDAPRHGLLVELRPKWDVAHVEEVCDD